MKREKRQREKKEETGRREDREERGEKVSQAVRQRFSDSRSCDRHKANSHTHTHFLYEM